MKRSSRFCSVLALLVCVSASTVLAASPKIEGTPVPIPPKPDFSALQFLVGTWTCTEHSSRRPGPFTVTQVYSMDPTGYWLIRNDTTHKASWIPREFHAQAKFTYDRFAKRLVRIVTSDVGGYSVATAPTSVANQRIFTFVIQAKVPDVSSYAPEVHHKISDTKKTMTTSFTENNGRVVNVKETCTKN